MRKLRVGYLLSVGAICAGLVSVPSGVRGVSVDGASEARTSFHVPARRMQNADKVLQGAPHKGPMRNADKVLVRR